MSEFLRTTKKNDAYCQKLRKLKTKEFKNEIEYLNGKMSHKVRKGSKITEEFNVLKNYIDTHIENE